MQYKLIKEYPLSPKLNTIISFINNDYSETNGISYYENDCKNNPEFWEKIEELCVPIGTKFTNYDKLYVIKDVIEEDIVVLHEVGEKCKRKPKAAYTTNFINECFKKGKCQIVKKNLKKIPK